MFTPIIVQLEWDGWTDRLIMPRDYLRLSTQERRLVTIEELRSWAPKEMRHVPDWGIARLFAATMLPGFNPSKNAFGVGAGYRVYSRVFVTDTALTTWPVPSDWNSGDNMVECLGNGGNAGGGQGGASGGIPEGGRGGNGGGGGYAMRANIALGTPTTPIAVGKADEATGTWFASNTQLLAAGTPSNAGALATACIGDVVTGGGNGGTYGLGGNGYFYQSGTAENPIAHNEGGGGGGGAGGGGAGGPSGAGANGFNGSKGGNATATPGGGGANGAGGDGGSPDGGTGSGANGADGGAGTHWDASHGSGAGGAGGNGGRGGNNSRGVNGSGGGGGGVYGSGGGGGGGGGGGNTSGHGGNGASGRAGLIVITNNASLTP